MSGRYSDMTSAVRESTAAQREMVSRQRLGNMINATAAVVAHSDARKTHGLLGETLSSQRIAVDLQRDAIRQSAVQHQEVIQNFYKLDRTISDIGDVLHTDLDDLKHGQFANWRDGPGGFYFYDYRPGALKYIEDFQNISRLWLQVLADRFAGIIADYPRWKRPEWRSDALRTGIFITPPAVPQPPQLEDIPAEPSVPPLPSFLWTHIRSFTIFLVTIFVLVLLLVFPSSRASTLETYSLKRYVAEQIGIERINEVGINSWMFFDDELGAAQLGHYECDPELLQVKAKEVDNGEIDFDYVCESMEEIANTSGRALKGIGLAVGVGFLLAGGPHYRRYKKRKTSELLWREHLEAIDEIEERNQRVLDKWEKAFNTELSRFQHQNEQAFETARDYIEQRMGIPMDGNLGEKWASVADRKRKEAVSQLVTNEVRRSPSRNDLISLKAFTRNQGLPGDLRAVAESLIELQTGSGRSQLDF